MFKMKEVEKLAVQTLKKDGYHSTIALVKLIGGEVAPCQLDYESEEQKEEILGAFRAYVKQHAEAYIFITEAAMRRMTEENKQYILDNYDTEAPLTYPESMRQECLIIHRVHRNGDKRTVVINFKIGEDKKVVIGDRQIFNHVDEFEGGMVNFFE